MGVVDVYVERGDAGERQRGVLPRNPQIPRVGRAVEAVDVRLDPETGGGAVGDEEELVFGCCDVEMGDVMEEGRPGSGLG